MKKIFYSMLFMAVVALTVVSCEKPNNDQTEPETKGGIVLIASNPEVEPETKTEFGPDFAPYWSKDDVLTAYGDYGEGQGDYSTLATFVRAGKDASKPALISEFTLSSDDVDIWDPTFYQMLYLCKGSSDGDENGVWDFKMKEVQKPGKVNQFDGAADYLIAKPIELNWDVLPEPIHVQLKRVNGIIKLNLNDVTTKKDHFKNKSVDCVILTTGNKANDFVGQISVDSKTGEMTAKTSHTYQKQLKVYPKSYRVGEKGSANSIYMSVLPTTIAAGEKMFLTVQFTDGDTFKKELVAPAGGVNVEAAKITTFNINFKDADVPAKGSVVVNGETITMNGVGQLQVADVETALSNSVQTPKRVAIKGDINALDMNSILLAVRNSSDMIDLDLTDANIKGHTTHTYTDYKGNGQKISKDNCLPGYLFAKCTQLQSVELPKSVVELGQAIFFQASGLVQFTIQHNVTTIADSMCDSDCTSLTTIYMLCGPSSDIAGTCIDGDNYGMTMGLTLYVNSEWGADTDSMLWNDTMFAEVINVTVDADGNMQ